MADAPLTGQQVASVVAVIMNNGGSRIGRPVF